MLQPPRPLRHAVVVIIEDGADTLLIERAATDTYPGYWSAVTGSLEAGETQQQACVREAREEVGLEVLPVRKLWESVTRGAHFVLHWWQCELQGSRAVTPDPREVGAYAWKSRAELLDVPLMFSDSRHFYRDVYEITRRR